MTRHNLPHDTLHNEVADALARGLVTPAEVASLKDDELSALAALCRDALKVGDLTRARMLAQALVVLSPYWALGWQLLATALELLKEPVRAAQARKAADILNPSAVYVDVPELPDGPHRPNAQDEALHGQTHSSLVLHDGRALPLRDTPAALHHDTVTSRITAQALAMSASHSHTARWAYGADNITNTAVVRRKDGATPASGAPDVTSKIDRQEHLRAMARRRLGRPVTDRWTLDGFDEALKE